MMPYVMLFLTCDHILKVIYIYSKSYYQPTLLLILLQYIHFSIETHQLIKLHFPHILFYVTCSWIFCVVCDFFFSCSRQGISELPLICLKTRQTSLNPQAAYLWMETSHVILLLRYETFCTGSWIFSSPEHNMLIGSVCDRLHRNALSAISFDFFVLSYCDSPLSVVHHCVHACINIFIQTTSLLKLLIGV